MNWQMIGAIGEIGGAIAVVLTLGYLARQVRESASQDRRHQSAQLVRDANQLAEGLARDPILPGIFLRGLRDAAALDEEETVRFGAWMLNAFRTQEALFYFAREGGLHDFQAGSAQAGLKDLAAAPGVQTWWAARRAWFSLDFQTEVDRWISQGSRSFLQRYDSHTTGES